MQKHDSDIQGQTHAPSSATLRRRMTGLFAAAAAVMTPSAAFAKNESDSFSAVAEQMKAQADAAESAPRLQQMVYMPQVQKPAAIFNMPTLKDFSQPRFADTRVNLSAPAWASDPRFAELVLDANTGEIVYERNGLAARNIASMTKVMTAYLVFDAMKKGKWTADTMLTASRYAASQAGMRFGLKPGQRVSVEQALNALITVSANDIAVLLAENLAGSESAFAQKMTETAHRLGAVRTTFGSASGRFGDDSTAYDMALIFRQVSVDFPALYGKYFTANCHWCETPDVAEIHATGRKTGTRSVAGYTVAVQVEDAGRKYIIVGTGAGSNPQRFGRAIEMGRAVWAQLPQQGVGVEMASHAPPPVTTASIATDPKL